ncbi:MAG: nucleoside triphosphate pyrophosphohydrolase [Ruminococcaceae bacterium]|nr:nucleoside triphosphate pyrophosphohydrolase [Oscillospiraceae bacterium]
MENFNFKERYDVNDLIDIVEILRSPNGCPWDREQDHKSIRRDFLEETYEVIESINKEDRDGLLEELGDVLLQVVFHAQIEREKNSFDLNDVADGVCKKMIERHPHVFGDVNATTSEQVLDNWDVIKKQTKQQKSQTESMLSIPREFPALMRADKVQKKAAKVGFDWVSVDGALDKVSEELGELKDAITMGVVDNANEELGDLLFSVVNVSRFISVDSEEALTNATDKFIDRFSKVEKMAEEKGLNMKETELSELDKLWGEAKKVSKKD